MLPPRYRQVTETLTTGGYGSVLPVLDTYLNRTVLFKRMKSDEHNDQLLNEIRGLSKARSRHVVEIYDIVTDNTAKLQGIVIEQLSGREFSNFNLDDGSDLNDYLRIVYQISVALDDLHRCGVVHRDLKLDNVRESASGIVKLFDFGISSTSSAYATRHNRGTTPYAAPELYSRGVVVTPAMDIYAMGICAWMLATQLLPASLLETPPQRTGAAPQFEQVVPDLIPPQVAAIIDRCVAVDPMQRPSAGEVRKVLSQHLVKGQHRGLFSQDTRKLYELSSEQPRVRIKVDPHGEIGVSYDGLVFRIEKITGDVYVNNATATIGMELHEACVLTFGHVSYGAHRRWVSFTSSHPEVIL